MQTPLAPAHGRPARQAGPAGGADPARRARHARRHDPAAAHGRGRLPRHGPRRGRRCKAETYATRLPEDLSGRQCYVLDPMLATGGTLAAAIELLFDRGADDVTAICLLAAPEGLARHGRGVRRQRQADPRGDRRRSTSGSTRTATSCPGSATPGTGSTASSDPPAPPVGRPSPARHTVPSGSVRFRPHGRPHAPVRPSAPPLSPRPAVPARAPRRAFAAPGSAASLRPSPLGRFFPSGWRDPAANPTHRRLLTCHTVDTYSDDATDGGDDTTDTTYDHRPTPTTDTVMSGGGTRVP